MEYISSNLLRCQREKSPQQGRVYFKEEKEAEAGVGNGGHEACGKACWVKDMFTFAQRC